MPHLSSPLPARPSSWTAARNGHGKRIKAVMDTAGVSQIDAFVATHYHEVSFARTSRQLFGSTLERNQVHKGAYCSAT